MSPSNPGPRPDISRAENYRSYLRDQYAFLKLSRKVVSYRALAKRLRMSPSYVEHILEERRHVTTNNILPLAKVFLLDDRETEFFTILVVRDITKDGESKEHFRKILHRMRSAFRSPSVHFREIGNTNRRFLSGNWLAAVLYELARFSEFRPDPIWIRGKLLDYEAVSNNQITATLQELQRRGLILEIEGRWRPYPVAHGWADSFDFRALEVHREALGKTHEALENPDRYRNCYFFSSTNAVDAETEERIILEFSRYREVVAELANRCENPDRVLLLTNSLINLVKRE